MATPSLLRGPEWQVAVLTAQKWLSAVLGIRSYHVEAGVRMRMGGWLETMIRMYFCS